MPGHLLCQSDARTIPLPDRSVHMVVTSPPYWGLRDYGTAAWEGGNDPACDHVPSREWIDHNFNAKSALGACNTQSAAAVGRWYKADGSCRKCGARRIDRQIGLEASPAEFIATMVRVFRAVWRVLRDDGTVWLNLGDSYSSSSAVGRHDIGREFSGSRTRTIAPCEMVRRGEVGSLGPKQLCGIPWRVALALQADGWYLRSDIIWAKPNPMPESVTDRPTKSHEYLFLLSKQSTYFYDAEAVREVGAGRLDLGRMKRPEARLGEGGKWYNDCGFKDEAGRNMRSVWTLPTESWPGAHFATFPRALVRPAILAGSSERGCCPKCGSGWVRVVETPPNIHPGSSHDHSADLLRGGTQVRADGKPAGSIMRERFQAGRTPSTLGWSPSCQCPPHAPVPCTILDPFAGSGTTLVVANALGRHGIGLDLSREYLTNQAQRRLERPHAAPRRPARAEPAMPLFGDIDP